MSTSSSSRPLLCLGLLLSSFATSTHAFLLPTSTMQSSSRSSSRSALRMSAAASSPPSEAELVKVFGRLADKAIFMDESAGQCCHSGCDNCEWRYDFDIMRAARPKWLVTYAERKFDSDAHTAKWKALFDAPSLPPSSSSSDEDIFNNETAGPTPLSSAALLAERLSALPFSAPLGPSVSVSGDEPLEAETAAWLWGKLVPEGSKSGTLTARLMEKRLKEWASGKDSMMWGDFVAKMSEA